jgi:hypothetical protein
MNRISLKLHKIEGKQTDPVQNLEEWVSNFEGSKRKETKTVQNLAILKVHKIENFFDFRIWILYYFIVSSA